MFIPRPVFKVSGLDAVRAKLQRAIEHDGAVRAALARWVDEDAYSMTYSIRNGVVILRIVENKPPPVDVALAFSDMVTNLRAALDILVWSIVEMEGNTPGRETAFPVIAEAKDWGSALGSRLTGFPVYWSNIIYDAQPFNYGPNARQHPLYLLHHLDIRNKHRLLVNLAVNSFECEPILDFNRATRKNELLFIEQKSAPFGQVVTPNGVELSRIRIISSHGDLEVTDILDMGNVRLGLGPAIDLTSAEGRLPNFIVFVGSVIEAIAPAFG